jgi:hypothetical protein
LFIDQSIIQGNAGELKIFATNLRNGRVDDIRLRLVQYESRFSTVLKPPLGSPF